MFGAVRSRTGDATEWSYTGEQHDATGLEYLRARYYDASTGRFLAQDPLPLPQRYAYVQSNPANYTDPFGLIGLGDIGKCIGDPVKCGKKVLDETAEGADATWDAAVEYEGGTIVNVLYTVGKAEVAVYRGCNWFADGAFDQCVASAIQLYDLCPLCPGAGLTQEVTATGAGIYQAWTSACTTKEKWGLTLTSVANGVLGYGARRVSKFAKLTRGQDLAVQATASSGEAAIFGGGAVKSRQCSYE